MIYNQVQNIPLTLLGPGGEGGRAPVTYMRLTALDQQKILKSNIILVGFRHPKFMNPFEYGQSFIG